MQHTAIQIAGAVAVVEAEGNDFSFGKPDDRDFVRMVLKGAGLPERHNGDPVLEAVATALFEDSGVTVTDAHALARFVLERLPEIVGARVRLVTPVERYPHFTAPAGALGVVESWDGEQVIVRLAEYLRGADEWDNCLHWYVSFGDEPQAEVTYHEAGPEGFVNYAALREASVDELQRIVDEGGPTALVEAARAELLTR